MCEASVARGDSPSASTRRSQRRAIWKTDERPAFQPITVSLTSAGACPASGSRGDETIDADAGEQARPATRSRGTRSPPTTLPAFDLHLRRASDRLERRAPRAGQEEVLVAHLEDRRPGRARAPQKAWKPPVENGFDVRRAPGVGHGEPAGADGERELLRLRRLRGGGRAQKNEKADEGAGARGFEVSLHGEDTSGQAGPKRCMLRIRRPASPRLESPRRAGRRDSDIRTGRPRVFRAPPRSSRLRRVARVCEAPRVDLGGGGVCRACWASLPLLDARGGVPALRAARPAALRARACRLTPPAVTRTAAFGLYAGGLRTLHHAFKFAGWDLLAAPLGGRLAALAAATGITDGADALVSVPSTRRRNRERGYDPAMLLADETARLLDTPRRALLSRTRDTPPQSSLPAARRRANVEGAFAASPRSRGRVLVLVDDVVTTGATLFAAARALREAGAREVRALVLARTPEPA